MRWFLEFPCPGLSRACAELRPSHRVPARGRRSRGPMSIEYCLPSACPHRGTRPWPECSGPSSVFPPHPPRPCPSGSGSSPTIAEAERSPADRWKPLASGSEAGPDKARSAQRENPIDQSEFSELPPWSWSSSPAIALAAPAQQRSCRARAARRTRRPSRHEMIGLPIRLERFLASWLHNFLFPSLDWQQRDVQVTHYKMFASEGRYSHYFHLRL